MKDEFQPGVRVKAKSSLKRSPWAERGYIKCYDREGFYVVGSPGKSDVIAHEDDMELAEEDVDLTDILDAHTFKLLLEASEKGEAEASLEIPGAYVHTRVTKKTGELLVERTLVLQKPLKCIWLKTTV